MLPILTTKTKPKGHQGTVGGVEYVYYLNFDDDITGVGIRSNSLNCAH